MPVMVEATAGVDGGGLTRQGNERFLQSLAAHESEFSTARGIDNFCISAGAVLLDHAIECVEGQADAVEGDGIAVGIPRIRVASVGEHVAVGVVGNHGSGNA